MTFDHDFGYSFPIFSSLLKKGKKKRRMSSKNRDQKSCLSARSFAGHQPGIKFGLDGSIQMEAIILYNYIWLNDYFLPACAFYKKLKMIDLWFVLFLWLTPPQKKRKSYKIIGFLVLWNSTLKRDFNENRMIYLYSN